MIEMAIEGSSLAREGSRPRISMLESGDSAVRSQSMTRWRLRAVLDGVLVLLVVSVAAGSLLTNRGGAQSQAGQAVLPDGLNGLPAIVPARPNNGQPKPMSVDIDILAAVIAAEHAALTPPIYFSDLPLISR